MFDFTKIVQLSLVTFDNLTYKQTTLEKIDVVNYYLKYSNTQLSEGRFNLVAM
jgi:hypothetical protein